MDSRTYRLAIIGCGSMGTAVLLGLLGATNDIAGPVTGFSACVRSEVSAKRLRNDLAKHEGRVDIVWSDNVQAAKDADIVLLGHKPYMLNAILGAPGMQDALKGKLIISILAGISIPQVKAALAGHSGSAESLSDEDYSILRVMPNMGAEVGESMSIIADGSRKVPLHFANVTSWIFGQIGAVRLLPDSIFDASTVLSGSGLALTTVAVDGMLDGAVAEGIPRATALEIIAQCLLGTAKMLRGGVHPAVLRESISSPRGCTIQALLSLERSAVRSAFADSIVHGTSHARKMGIDQA